VLSSKVGGATVAVSHSTVGALGLDTAQRHRDRSEEPDRWRGRGPPGAGALVLRGAGEPGAGLSRAGRRAAPGSAGPGRRRRRIRAERGGPSEAAGGPSVRPPRQRQSTHVHGGV